MQVCVWGFGEGLQTSVIIYEPTVVPCHSIQYKCGHFSTMQMNNSSAFLSI